MHYLQTQLDQFVHDIQVMVEEHRRDRFPSLPHYQIGVDDGRAYWRIWRKGGGGSTTVFAFVRKDDGAILKPATWNAPQTKTKSAVRGYIHDADPMRCVNPYGVNYAR